MSNEQKPRRWVQWSEAQAREVLDAFASSGMSLTAFAQSRGVSPHRITYWRDKLALPSPGPLPSFLPIRVTSTQPRSAEIVLCVGELTLRMREDIELTRLVALVHALSARSPSC